MNKEQVNEIVNFVTVSIDGSKEVKFDNGDNNLMFQVLFSLYLIKKFK